MESGTVQINSAPARGPDHFPFQVKPIKSIYFVYVWYCGGWLESRWASVYLQKLRNSDKTTLISNMHMLFIFTISKIIKTTKNIYISQSKNICLIQSNVLLFFLTQSNVLLLTGYKRQWNWITRNYQQHKHDDKNQNYRDKLAKPFLYHGLIISYFHVCVEKKSIYS